METAPRNAGRTARDRARAQLTREIKEEARRQLAEHGADGLSLRAVARALGMVSSALYRYFPSRDDLLTALIIDSYDSLGEAAEAADPGPNEQPRLRWLVVCAGVREWALAHRHEYALIYGSPIPGYRAPRATVAPASRVALLFTELIRTAWEHGQLIPQEDPRSLEPELVTQLGTLGGLLALELPQSVLARMLVAWTQLFGMISFELYGQLVGSVDPSGYFFGYSVERMADFIGFDRHNQE